MPQVLRMLDPAVTERPIQLDQVFYFLSTIELRPRQRAVMARWRTRLFLATRHLTANAAEHFGPPRERTLVMGSHIEV